MAISRLCPHFQSPSGLRPYYCSTNPVFLKFVEGHPGTVIGLYVYFFLLSAFLSLILSLAYSTPTGCRCRGLFLHLTTIKDTQTPDSVGLLWTSDQPDAETCTWQHTAFQRIRHSCPWWDSNPQSQQSSGRRRSPVSWTIFLIYQCILFWG